MAAKKPARGERPRGDSPINIGGGGGRRVRGRLVPFFVYATFDHSVYVPDPEDQATFNHPTLRLNPARVLINGSAPVTAVSPPTPVAVTADSEIVIRYKKTGAPGPAKQKIVVNGGLFGVTFKAAHLPFNYLPNNKHENTGWEIKKVTIDGTAVKINTAAGDSNEIEVHTI